MRAVQINEYGPPEVLQLVDALSPEPGPGEVSVDVAAIGTIYSETQVRSGALLKFGLGGHEFPYIFGRDVAGTIDSVGEGVDPKLQGERVVASTSGTGGYAEKAIVAAPAAGGGPGHLSTIIPDDLSVEDACALLGQGRTALGLFEEVHIESGDTVLVTAGGGAVGTLLVQMAHHAGAHVVAAAGGSDKAELLTGLGAELVVDYREPAWEAEVRNHLDGGVQFVFDATGGHTGRAAVSLAQPGDSTIVLYGLASGAPPELSVGEILGRGLAVIGFAGPKVSDPARLGELQERVLHMAAKGRIRPVIGQRFALDEAAAAHAAMEERRTVGKTLLLT